MLSIQGFHGSLYPLAFFPLYGKLLRASGIGTRQVKAFFFKPLKR
jgi:hypothetical protein